MAQRLPNSKTIKDYAGGFEVIAATAAASAVPDYILPTGDATVVRTYVKVSGTITDLAIQIHYYVDGVWYDGPTTDEGDALTGTANEVRDWYTERGTEIGFTVDTIAGGGTVTVRAEAVERN